MTNRSPALRVRTFCVSLALAGCLRTAEPPAIAARAIADEQCGKTSAGWWKAGAGAGLLW